MAGLVYKWRIGNCKNAFLTDKNGGSPFITVDIVDEEKISLIVKNFTEEEYKSKYEEMCTIIANDPDGKNMVMLNYKYYYNVDETSCGLLQYKGDIYTGDQGPSGVGIRDIDTIHGTTYTIIRIYLTNGTFYDVTIPNGRNGIDGGNGTDGSDGEHRNVIYELETKKEELENLREDILAEVIKELEDKLKLSQDALDEFAKQLSGLTHSIGSATTHVDNVIGLEEKVNIYINYSAMTKTEFNNVINPYSGFMATIGQRIDLLSSSVTYYEDKVDLANSELKEAMSYYDKTANQLNEYWRKYDAVNNRLESVVAELTGNSTVSLSEIYQTAKEVGIMVTSSGNTDVNGNPIMAAIIAQINDTGSTITLDATKIYMLGETVASALTTIDLDINGGHSHFSADGSGWIANHGIEWDKSGSMSIKGQLSIGEVVEELGEKDITLGKHTEARTIFAKDGSGSLAGGNIYWDKYGMLTIKKDVKIEGTLSVDEIANSLGNKIISFGKENSDATTYFYPDGSGSLAGGSISWDTDGSIKIAGNLTVGGSIVQEVVDSLDNENVSLGGGSANFDGSTGSGSLAGGLIKWERNNDGTASMKIDGNVTIGNTTSADTVNGVIAALNVSDLSIGSGSTRFNKDGSGYLAHHNIRWSSGGTLDIVANIENRNGITWNGFELNVDKGYFRMYGPNSVDDDNRDLPSEGAKEIDLFRIDYEVDPDSLSRVSTIYMHGAIYTLRIDPIEGISLTNENEKDNAHYGLIYSLNDTGLYFYESDGVYKAVLEKYSD